MNTDQTPQTPLRHAEGSRGGLDWLDGGKKRIFPKDWLNKNADGFWVDDFGWQNIQKKTKHVWFPLSCFVWKTDSFHLVSCYVDKVQENHDVT